MHVSTGPVDKPRLWDRIRLDRPAMMDIGARQMRKDVTSGIGNNPQDYQQQRYRSLDQAWVNWREQRILAQLLMQCQLAKGTMLDVPCGYSRFAPLYARLGITAIGADASYDMAHLAAANHAPHGQEHW